MSEPGFASLGPSLLARKGGAKPAMRPQVAPLVIDGTGVPADQLEDLGWNDMGDSDGDPGFGADIVPINADVSADDLAASSGPIVRRQQRRLEERVLADAVMTGPQDAEPEYDEDDEPDYGAAAGFDHFAEDDQAEEAGAYAPPTPPAPTVQAASRPARIPAAQTGRRAAFTLRLDADRHLKLRLAATMQGVSAQVLVTEALDRLLAEYDDLDVIANHLNNQIKRH